MKKFTFAAIFLFAVGLVSSSFKSKKNNFYHSSGSPLRSGGAAAVGGAGRTGAPFDAGTCGNSGCHSGGSFAPTINVELINASNVPVTKYTPGVNYTLRITLAATTGLPQWGFQTTCVKSSDNSNVNRWGTGLQAGTANVGIANGRNYVEHFVLLPTGIINIPWTAPLANFGPVTFYSIGNAVDGSGGTSNDNPTVSNVLSITELTSAVPITLISFNGKQANTGIDLQWETAQEINNAYFVVEHSTNGIDFTPVGKIEGGGNSSTQKSYTFNHKYSAPGTNYYRLAQTDFDGQVKTSSIITIQNKNNAGFFTVTPNPIVNKLVLKSNFTLVGNRYVILNSAGTLVLSGVFTENEIDVQQLPKGNYYIRVQKKESGTITERFVK
jgi:hypothetical protein